MAAGYYELRRGRGWSFVLKAANHQVILSSQSYRSRASAEGGIASVRGNGGCDERFERKLAKSGQPYFVLLAANGQVIGNSQMYESEAARDKGIESVRTHCGSEVVKEVEEG